MASHHSVRAFLPALPPLIATVGWVVAAGVAARAVPGVIGAHSWAAGFALYGIAILGGLGGLVGFWYSVPSLEFFVRGFRLRTLDDGSCAYEERRPDGSIAMLPVRFVALADEYRPPCQVHLPSPDSWDAVVPAWARGRRDEIVRNIARDLGAEFGRTVQFVDAPAAPDAPPVHEQNGGSAIG